MSSLRRPFVPELPAGFGSMSVRSIREDRMYVIDTDELGVDYVVKVSANWRVVFRFDGGDVRDVDLVDYH